MSEVIDLTTLSESSSADGDSVAKGSLYESDSDVSEVEIHLNEETRIQLKNAVNTISAVRLREVLARLIDRELPVEIALSKELITFNPETRAIVPRWETCPNCYEDYDVNTQREDGECQFHPGESAVDKTAFVDHDENVYGPMDTEENRAFFPEKFTWSCCQGRRDDPGCVRNQHQASALRKRRRL